MSAFEKQASYVSFELSARKEKSEGIGFITKHIVIIISHKLVLATVILWRLAAHIFTAAVSIFPLFLEKAKSTAIEHKICFVTEHWAFIYLFIV